MQYFAYGLMAIAMFAALGIVLAGLIISTRGGEVNRKWGNKLMRYRVIAQGVALLLFVIGFWISKNTA